MVDIDCYKKGLILNFFEKIQVYSETIRTKLFQIIPDADETII
jgi:hypothetical protein